MPCTSIPPASGTPWTPLSVMTSMNDNSRYPCDHFATIRATPGRHPALNWPFAVLEGDFPFATREAVFDLAAGAALSLRRDQQWQGVRCVNPTDGAGTSARQPEGRESWGHSRTRRPSWSL